MISLTNAGEPYRTSSSKWPWALCCIQKNSVHKTLTVPCTLRTVHSLNILAYQPSCAIWVSVAHFIEACSYDSMEHSNTAYWFYTSSLRNEVTGAKAKSQPITDRFLTVPKAQQKSESSKLQRCSCHPIGCHGLSKRLWHTTSRKPLLHINRIRSSVLMPKKSALKKFRDII